MYTSTPRQRSRCVEQHALTVKALVAMGDGLMISAADHVVWHEDLYHNSKDGTYKALSESAIKVVHLHQRAEAVTGGGSSVEASSCAAETGGAEAGGGGAVEAGGGAAAEMGVAEAGAGGSVTSSGGAVQSGGTEAGHAIVIHIHAAADGIAARYLRGHWPEHLPLPLILQSDIIPGQEPRKGPAEQIDAITAEGKRTANGFVQPTGSVDFSAVRAATGQRR